MFERMTNDARRVIMLAQEQTRTLGHPKVGTEHLLLGVAELPHGVPANRVLRRFGGTTEVLRAAVVELVGHGDAQDGGHIPFTVRAKRVLELAMRESRLARSNDIDAEHVLLGIVDEDTGTGARALAACGVDAAELRAALGSQVPPEVVSVGMRTPAVDEVLAVAERLAAGTPVALDHLRRALDHVDGGRAAGV